MYKMNDIWTRTEEHHGYGNEPGLLHVFLMGGVGPDEPTQYANAFGKPGTGHWRDWSRFTFPGDN